MLRSDWYENICFRCVVKPNHASCGFSKPPNMETAVFFILMSLFFRAAHCQDSTCLSAQDACSEPLLVLSCDIEPIWVNRSEVIVEIGNCSPVSGIK